MKYKYIISVFIFGLLLWFFAAWSKITHKAYADAMVNISFDVIALACILAIIKLLFNKKDRFLNR